MSRALLISAVYAVAWWTAFGCLAVLAAIHVPIPGGWAAPLVLLVGALPSILCRIYWRDHFRGRRLLNEGRPEEAEAAFRAFRETFARDAVVRALTLFAVFGTTRSFGAITWNNIGVAQLEQRRAKEALLSFELAVHEDDRYDLARWNALVAAHAARDSERFNAHRDTLIAGGATQADIDAATATFDARLRQRAQLRTEGDGT